MPPTRTRAVTATAGALLLAAGGMATPTLAADSPEAAVNDFFDLAASGDFSDLDRVVCAADQAGVRETFDFGASLGLADDDPLGDALRVEIGDRSVELLSESDDEATVRVRATTSVSVPEDRLEDLVRAILAADLGPDDPPPSDDDVEMMLGFMGSAFDQTMALDEEVTVVREDGEWLVCGGLVEAPEEPVAAAEPWPAEGLCGLLDIDAVNALGALQYTTASGFETVCTIASPIDDFGTYHSATLALNEGYDYETFQQAFGLDRELEVAGYPAFAAGEQIFVQVGDDVLQVGLYLGEQPPAGIDAVAQAVGLAELVIPDLGQVATPTPAPTPEPTPEIALCEGIGLEQLNELTGLGFDDASSDATSCQFLSVGGERGFHFVTAYTADGTLELYTMWLPEYEESTVAGQPALVTAQQTVIELPGDGGVLDISVSIDASDEQATLSASEVAAILAELLVPRLSER